MISSKLKGGIVIELGWTITFALLVFLLLALEADWYYILGSFVLLLWCLKGFIREIKDKDVKKVKEERMKIEEELNKSTGEK